MFLKFKVFLAKSLPFASRLTGDLSPSGRERERGFSTVKVSFKGSSFRGGCKSSFKVLPSLYRVGVAGSVFIPA